MCSSTRGISESKGCSEWSATGRAYWGSSLRSQSRQEKKPIKIHVPSPDDNVPIIIERKISDYAKPQEIKLSPKTVKRDMFTGEILPQSPDEEFLARITDFVSNYSKKSYEQVWPSSPPKSRERVAKRPSHSAQNKIIPNSRTPSEGPAKSTPDHSMTGSKEIIQSEAEYPQPEVLPPATAGDSVVESAPVIPAPPDQPDDGIPPEETDFLNKVSSFVTQYSNSEEYAQKIWPSTPKQSTRSEKRKKTMSPGKSFINNDAGDVQWFGRSIEADSYEAQVQVEELEKRKKSKEKVVKNNLSAGAALMRQHLSASEQSKEPERRWSGHNL